MIGLRQASALVVDDSETMRHLVTGMLARFGVPHIEEAASGEEAINKINASNFTLIISDWNMEPIDGLALLRAVKVRQKPRVNRFIFMTTERSWGHRTSAKIEGADEFIAKPFQADTLRAKIEQVLARC